MDRRSFVKTAVGCTGIAALGPLTLPAHAGAGKPNIVVILADDLGYGDLSCYGATTVKTPVMDNLAGQGMLFTDAHAPHAVCTPSRYSMLTGRYCWRTNMKIDCVFGHDTLLIEEDRMTAAAMLQSIGYRTACIGKWHLGFGKSYPDWNGDLKPGPLERGFDYYFGIPVTNAQAPFVFVENHRVVGLDPHDPIRLGAESKTNQMTGGKAARYKPEDLAINETGKAVGYIERQTKDRPFFLYFTPSNVHSPYTPNPRFRGTGGCGIYCDFIRELDWSVGEILAALDRTGLADNTLVILTSDNGAVYTREAYDAGQRSNGDFLGQKTDVWEGGHRVPFIARWPKKIPEASRSGEVICLVDFMATAAAAAGVDLSRDAAPDSFNLLPVLLGQTSASPARGGAVILQSYEGMLAVRQGDWILILGRGSGGTTTDYSKHVPGMHLEELGLKTTGWAMQGCMPDPRLPRGQLYNLAQDRGETRNLYGSHPEIVSRLTDVLVGYRANGRSRP